MRSFIPILLLIPCAALAAQEGIYKWTDARGVTHYSDQKPADQQAQQIHLPLEGSDVVRREPQQPSTEADFAALEFQEETHTPEIILYSWQDNRGITHYGNRPPPEQQVNPIDLRQPPGTRENQ